MTRTHPDRQYAFRPSPDLAINRKFEIETTGARAIVYPTFRTAGSLATPTPHGPEVDLFCPLPRRNRVFTFRAASLWVAGETLTLRTGVRIDPVPAELDRERVFGTGNEREIAMNRSEHAGLSKVSILPLAQARKAARIRHLLAARSYALAFGALVLGLMPQTAPARPPARLNLCIEPGDKARCERDTQCCEGAVCMSVCRSGCKIWLPTDDPGLDSNGDGYADAPHFFAPGELNPDNDCQVCDPGADRFNWSNLNAGTACGSGADTECTNPDTCDGTGTCLANDEPTTAICGDDGTECTNQDYCDGSGGCTDNGYVEADTPCGSDSETECDNPDTCDGSGTCLDNHEPTSTTCGDAGTECTNQDYCDGNGGCADYGYVAAATPCGSNADTECTNPDTCDGSGTCLPNNEPATITCGDSEQPCRFQDFCNGSGSCEDKGFEPASTACGDSTDNECDNADHCSGVDNSCVPAFEPAGTACGDAGTACTNQDTCDGQGVCTDNGFKDSSATCMGTANGGPCDDDANDHCDGNGACEDAFKPSSFACVLPRDAFGNYTCKEVVYCTGDSSTCPAPDINVFDPSIPCRDGGFGVHAFCNPPEYCTGYGVCGPSEVLPGGTCDGGTRDGQWCDLFEENGGLNPCGIGFHCVPTVCPGATLPCEKPWTCDYSGHCLSNGFLPAGTDCLGLNDCEKYSCDAVGNCVDQGVTRDATASCRPPANECDVRDFCGDPDEINKCSISGTTCAADIDCPIGETCVLESRGRSDFESYPDCGPDLKQPYGTPCTYLPLGEDAPGVCIAGECNPIFCKHSIDCADGWVCGCPPGQVCPTTYCVPAPAEGGYGDVCSVRGYCNKFAESPGRGCTTREECDPGNIRPDAKCLQSYCDYNSGIRQGVGCESSEADCRNATHPFGECVLETRGTCGPIPSSTIDYVCCAGMAGDGRGGVPGLGQTGRCQECCGNGGVPDQNCTNLNDPGGSRFYECCDGKCTDIISDIHNCAGCNYDGGVDCTNLTSACSPGVVKCDALNFGDGCVMEFYCDDTADANGWTAAACYIPEVQVPVPGCDYCVAPSRTPGQPCLTEEDCGGFTFETGGIVFSTNYCYHDPSLFCFADRTYAYTTAPECREPPFSGCEPICCEIDHTPNVGATCEDDSDCFGGTSCITSCDIARHGQVFDAFFCGASPTCQFLGGEPPDHECVAVPYP